MAKYFYNNVELPDINTVWTDNETYPYAVIEKSQYGDSLYFLHMLQTAPYIEGNNIYLPGDRLYCSTNAESTWGTVNSGTGPLPFGKGFITWSSTDILNEDGTLYLAASAPVPVSPSPIDADLYIKKGNKVFKVDGNASSGTGSSCNCPNIITANSKAELPDPSTVPEGTIAIVPSEAWGVFEYYDDIYTSLTVLDDDSIAALNKITKQGTASHFWYKRNGVVSDFATTLLCTRTDMGESVIYTSTPYANLIYVFAYQDGQWGAQVLAGE